VAFLVNCGSSLSEEKTTQKEIEVKRLYKNGGEICRSTILGRKRVSNYKGGYFHSVFTEPHLLEQQATGMLFSALAAKD